MKVRCKIDTWKTIIGSKKDKYPEKGKVYTVKDSIRLNAWRLAIELAEFPPVNGKLQLFSANCFDIIHDDGDGQPITNETKPNSITNPPVIVGLPGT